MLINEIQTEIKQDKAYCYAYAIKEDKAGGKYLYCLEDDHFYQYHDGHWSPLFEVEFLGKIQESMKDITKLSIAKRKQIIENFKQLGRKNLSQFNWSELLNFKNGMVCAYDGLIENHNHIFYSTNRIPYIYCQESKCPLWIKTLNEILESDHHRINILQEFFGYCLTRETKHHKALLLLGESRSGKSTILQTLRNVIGIKNCSSVPLKYISNAQYTAQLINKLVNIDTDVSSKAEQFEAEFKTITSGEPVSVNQKYVAAFDFVPYCKIVMAANIFPKITDHSSAFYNRLIIVPCEKIFTYEEQNRDLPKQLLLELPGILNWSIEGLKRLNKRGRFEDLDFMKNAVQELENENNPAQIFFEDHIEIEMNSNAYVTKPELYEKYIQWCIKTNNFKLSDRKFNQCVLKKYMKQTSKDSRIANNGPRIWKNIKYVQFKSNGVKQEVHWQDPSLSTIKEDSQQDINWEE